jgi:hypothetical protein
VAVLVGSGAGWFGRWHWLLDLTTHFRWYWLLAALGGLAACLRWPRPTAVACLAVAVVINARDLMPAWLPPAAAKPAAMSPCSEMLLSGTSSRWPVVTGSIPTWLGRGAIADRTSRRSRFVAATDRPW